MKFQDKLFTLRKKAGMTQNDLAEKLNVSRQAVSRWEMGTAMPDVDNLIAMSDLFGVSLDALLKDRDSTPSEDVPIPGGDKPRYMDFVPKFWWWFALLAVGFRLIPYVLGVLIFVNTDFAYQLAAAINLCYMLSFASVAAMAGCFLYGLLQWRK